MSRIAGGLILGFHGCSPSTAQAALAGQIDLQASERDFDWLGNGTYFWEWDEQRAQEWAAWKVSRGNFDRAAVIGAVIDPGNCLDLLNRKDLDLVREAHESFLEYQTTAGLRTPVNRNAKGDPHEDLLLRFLDCAVINHLHSIMETRGLEPFDSVRGMFREGAELYAGAGFRDRSHVQIAVRRASCIKGYFLPR